METAAAPRAPPVPVHASHRRHFPAALSQSHPLVYGNSHKENRPPLDSLLQPSPAAPFPWRRGPPLSSKLRHELSVNSVSPDSSTVKQDKGKRMAIDQSSQDQGTWLGQVRQKLSPLRPADLVSAPSPKSAHSISHPSQHSQPFSNRILRPSAPFPRPPQALPSPPQAPRSTPRARPIHSPLESYIAPAAPKSRFSTRHLSPVRHDLKRGGSIEVLEGEGEVLLDLSQRSGAVMLVSGDSERISIFRPRLGSRKRPILLHPDEVYSRETLPEEWRKAFALCGRFVNSFNGRLPRMSTYLDISCRLPGPFGEGSAKSKERHRLTIYSDSPPSYSLCVPSAPSSSPSAPQSPILKVRVDRARSQLTLTSQPLSEKATTLPLPLNTSSADFRALSVLEQNAMRLALAQNALVEQLQSALDGREEEQRIERRAPGSLEQEQKPRQSNKGNAEAELCLVIERLCAGDKEETEGEDLVEGRVVSGPKRKREKATEMAEIVRDEREVEEWEEQCRYLQAAGWSIRRRPRRGPVSRHADLSLNRPPAPWTYRFLFHDGFALELDVETQRIRMSDLGEWHQIDERVPKRVKRRLGLAQEMLELFRES